MRENCSRSVYNLQDINEKYTFFLTITLIPFKFKNQNGSYENVLFFFLRMSNYCFGLVLCFGICTMLLHQTRAATLRRTEGKASTLTSHDTAFLVLHLKRRQATKVQVRQLMSTVTYGYG
jgi:hypothetical protein